MKKVGMMFAFVLLLAACSGGNSGADVTCELDYGDSQSKEIVKVEYDGDKKAEKIIITKEAALADYLFEEHDVEELEKLFEADYVNPDIDQKGLTFDISIDKKKKKLSVKVEADISKVSKGDMKNLGLDNYKDVKKIVKDLKASGYECGKVE
ncbi:hypothetical protein M2475_002249 [Breznakia sp. PF5-3]|uniref:hypothetical protein n=1 Tax=unclassified Breznakia TaxID=2623764 RepID=UPI00240712D0|nr:MULTISPECIES: hypothetical protein [unclassified Breznakia]MDF9825869.1 hypothetical protein [Breznakia sp. PM6-1]MDF9836667.1 hypothetical protein [Breznakia sp. PF5-3]MDF9838940.1 hypothetical protein [Breznakia sp. PFB2-8]MDF9860965.1 hypothetical protein [Breznakia sp. PH5-24]